LFALAQVVIDPSRDGATVVCPNPFYQIYEGAARCWPGHAPRLPQRPAAQLRARLVADRRCHLVARATRLRVLAGNPTGAVMPLPEWRKLFELSERHGFVIASDECYSEIYFRDDDGPPLGGLQAAQRASAATTTATS
jgi:N-succinyldiaminopimelate aminotransferase